MSDSIDHIKQLVRNAEIRFITIDTSILRKHGFHFDSGILEQLKQFKNSRFKLVISEIVLKETERQIKEAYVKDLSGWQKIFNRLKDYPVTDEDVISFDEILAECTPEQYSFWKMNKFQLDTGAEQISVGHADIKDIADLYFSQKAPFDSGMKKSEFPDAIALLGFLNWCESTHSGMIVVSDDLDWKRFCAENPDKLHHIESIATALEVINESESIRSERTAARIEAVAREFSSREQIEKIRNQLLQKLSNQATAVGETRYKYNAEIEKISVIDLDFNGLMPIRHDDAAFVLFSEVKAKCEFWGDFDFFNEHPKKYIGSGVYSITKDVEAGAIFSADGDEISIEVFIPQELVIDFGLVEPDENGVTSHLPKD